MKDKILIVSDDETGESLRRALEEEEFDVTLAESANDGYRLMVEGWFDLVVVNLDSAVTGADLIKRIRANSDLGQSRVLTIAAWGTGQATMALSNGADAFEPKPVGPDRLVDAIERLLRPGLMLAARASTTNRDLEESNR